MATQTILLTSGTSLNVFPNWDGVTAGTINLIGPGGGGYTQTNAKNTGGGGGGGGAYAYGTYTWTAGGAVSYAIPAGNGLAPTTFGTGAGQLSADYGRTASTASGAAGGLASNCAPSTNAQNGGTGGSGASTTSTYGAGGGGGGAGGPGYAGKNGGSVTPSTGATGNLGAAGGGGAGGGSLSTVGSANSTTTGGAGGAGPTGTSGGASDGGNGSNGSGGGGGNDNQDGGEGGAGAVVWTDSTTGATAGPGGGGGGGSNADGNYSDGGNYGGGGGGSSDANNNSVGGAGLIALQYNTIAASVAQTTFSSATTVTIDQPAGAWASGNTLVLIVAVGSSNTVPTTPSGWTLVSDTHTSGGPPLIAVYTLTLASAGPPSYTVTLGATQTGSATIIEYPASLTAGLDATVTPAITNGTTSTSPSLTGVTTAAASETVVAAMVLAGGSRTIAGTSWSSQVGPEVYQLGPSGAASIYVADGVQASAGATGNITATLSASATSYDAIVFALKNAVTLTNQTSYFSTGAETASTAKQLAAFSLEELYLRSRVSVVGSETLDNMVGSSRALAESLYIVPADLNSASLDVLSRRVATDQSLADAIGAILTNLSALGTVSFEWNAQKTKRANALAESLTRQTVAERAGIDLSAAALAHMTVNAEATSEKAARMSGATDTLSRNTVKGQALADSAVSATVTNRTGLDAIARPFPAQYSTGTEALAEVTSKDTLPAETIARAIVSGNAGIDTLGTVLTNLSAFGAVPLESLRGATAASVSSIETLGRRVAVGRASAEALCRVVATTGGLVESLSRGAAACTAVADALGTARAEDQVAGDALRTAAAQFRTLGEALSRASAATLAGAESLAQSVAEANALVDFLTGLRNQVALGNAPLEFVAGRAAQFVAALDTIATVVIVASRMHVMPVDIRNRALPIDAGSGMLPADI